MRSFTCALHAVFFITPILLFFFPANGIVLAQSDNESDFSKVTFVTDVVKVNFGKNEDGRRELSGFINGVITLTFSVSSIILVIYIAWYGTMLIYQQLRGDVFQSGNAKNKMVGAIYGITVILCSYIILKFFTPNLLKNETGFLSSEDRGRYGVGGDGTNRRIPVLNYPVYSCDDLFKEIDPVNSRIFLDFSGYESKEYPLFEKGLGVEIYRQHEVDVENPTKFKRGDEVIQKCSEIIPATPSEAVGRLETKKRELYQTLNNSLNRKNGLEIEAKNKQNIAAQSVSDAQGKLFEIYVLTNDSKKEEGHIKIEKRVLRDDPCREETLCLLGTPRLEDVIVDDIPGTNYDVLQDEVSKIKSELEISRDNLSDIDDEDVKDEVDDLIEEIENMDILKTGQALSDFNKAEDDYKIYDHASIKTGIESQIAEIEIEKGKITDAGEGSDVAPLYTFQYQILFIGKGGGLQTISGPLDTSSTDTTFDPIKTTGALTLSERVYLVVIVTINGKEYRSSLKEIIPTIETLNRESGFEIEIAGNCEDIIEILWIDSETAYLRSPREFIDIMKKVTRAPGCRVTTIREAGIGEVYNASLHYPDSTTGRSGRITLGSPKTGLR